MLMSFFHRQKENILYATTCALWARFLLLGVLCIGLQGLEGFIRSWGGFGGALLLLGYLLLVYKKIKRNK